MSSTARAFFLFVILFFALSPPARAGRVECSAVKSAVMGHTVRYCAMLPPTYDTEKTRRYPVLYYLHGLFENEQTFVDFGGWNLLEELQDSGRVGEYLVVIPNGGQSFYVNSKDGRQRYEDFFVREFLPAMEKKYRIQAGRATRGIAGVSMGGYGALHMAFKYPQLFVSVSAHSAALIENIPATMPAGAGRLQARLAVLGDVFGRPFDRTYWEQNNPLTMAKQSNGLARLKIYFDCGTEDEYNFDAGAKALHEALKKRGIAHEFHLYPGGHGPIYLAEHVEATFEFHSKAFGIGKAAK